jgi:NAD(P)H-hydrate epimerase
MIKLFTVSQMVAVEKAADAAGLTYAQMMETAGKGVAQAIIERWPVAGQVVTVLVGPGNNGGDGLVAGRYLAEAGASVTFYLYKPRDPEQDENLAKVHALGLPTLIAEFDQRYRVLRHRLNITDILIDALLGTGVSRPITGELAKLMNQVSAGLEERALILDTQSQSPITNLQSLPNPKSKIQNPKSLVVAVDCPSGLNTDTGQLDPAAIPADLTVTFAGPKRGHFRFPGAAACGELVVADIGIPADLPEYRQVAIEVATAQTARTLLPPRPADGHKGTFGSVCVAAGSHNYWGAPVLAGRAAYRAGAGLVALAVPSAIRAAVAVQLPEATYPPVEDLTPRRKDARDAKDEPGMLGVEAARRLLEGMEQYKALLVGPGLGKAAAFLKALLAADSLPATLIDADGLNLLTEETNWWETLPAATILTPHPGEMARLNGLPLDELKQLDRVTLAMEKAAAWNCILLLKGAYTVIAAPDGRCTLLPFANPIMAVAGSGDVLSGIIAGLLAQGMAAYEAAVLGGYLHGAAGQLAEARMGNAGLLAHEIADYIPLARRSLTSAVRLTPP